MAAARQFTPATLRFDGATRRGFSVTCGYCGKPGKVAVNSFRVGAGHDGDQESRYVRKKFSDEGWKIGDREKDDRCPECFAKILNAAANRKIENKGTSSVVELRPKPAAEPNREMQLDDRRIIFSTINERYLSKDKGYQDGWSDIRVSTDLGVPLEWVQKLRQENFGPEGANEQLRAELAAAKADCVALVPRLGSLFKLIEANEKSLAALRKSAEEFEIDGSKCEERLTKIEKMLRGDAV
jgi:hypothetical protein